MDRKLRNRVLIALVAAGIIAFLLVEWSGREPVTQVEVVKPKKEDMVASISSNGKVEPIAPYAVAARLDTFVERVLVKEGENVKKGQAILELDVKSAAASLAQARGNLLRAQEELRAARAGGRADDVARVKGDLEYATAERDRLRRENNALKRLVGQHAATAEELASNEVDLAKAEGEFRRLAGSKEEFDRQIKVNLERATLQVLQAGNDVAALEKKVRMGRVTAPSPGTLYALPARAGSFVKVGDLLAEMADLRKVQVRAFIDEPELGVLEPDQPVVITWDALPNRSWQGKTAVIPKQVVARGTRSVGELLCAVNNEKLELLPNINVNVKIHSKERHDVLAIPRGAVQVESGRRFVYLVQEGIGKTLVVKREVQVGIASATSYEILGGLKEDDRVALPGAVDLADGMTVQIANPR
ncbi:MAG: efflux RND transporter periplasmic adaptor subunit [Acidobacteriia bacterium]|nr:efflux RND transporter periplasmic adaptor subunit [Terriglobia bacterium]